MSNVFSGLFKKSASPLEDAFSEIEDEFSKLILEEMETPPLDPFSDDNVSADPDMDAGADADADADAMAGQGDGGYDHRLTSYTQSRLASLSTFEDMHRDLRGDLELLAATLARVSATYHSTSEFIGTVHNGIHRSNELELANAALLLENRRLSQTADRVKRLSSQLEALTEGYKRREAKFNADAETLRIELATSQLEANEMRGQISAMEREHADLINELTAKTATLERTARDAELLREKQVNLTMDVETTKRRYQEIERKHDELAAIHNTEQSIIVELRARCAANDKEAGRVQKLLDASQARLAEYDDAIAALENEGEMRDRRQTAQIEKLSHEIDALKARLEASGRSLQSSNDEVGSLNQKVADLIIDNKIAAETIVGLKKELESERKLIAAGRNGPADGEAAKEIDALRKEMETMQATIVRLSKYEDMYKRTMEKRVAKGAGAAKSGATLGTAEAAE